jgi:N-carbamoyl-L-amino-acid hydrolase
MGNVAAETLQQAVSNARSDAERLFVALAACSIGGPGITRDTYGHGENTAHRIVAEHAAALGLEVSTDAAANTYMTLPGIYRAAPGIIIGSHLDSVPNGGNFDGAAGVVGGLTAVAALRSLGIAPSCDVCVMAIRAEESVWFQISYIGSRAALGSLPPNALGAPRIDTKRKLAEHIADAGGDPVSLERGVMPLEPLKLRAFLELHIEQAQTLIVAGKPIGIGTAVPGNFRYANAVVRGRYDHVGTPRGQRQDAVLAAAEFATRLDQLWEQNEADGTPMALTLGRFHTDAAHHGLTKVPGELAFSLDIRAYRQEVLATMEEHTLAIARDIVERRRVTFAFGPRAEAPVAISAPEISAGFAAAAEELGIPCQTLLSPANHDAAAFAYAGVPIGMIFIRNANGSHNPDEAMEIDDFLDGVAILTSWLVNA